MGVANIVKYTKRSSGSRDTAEAAANAAAGRRRSLAASTGSRYFILCFIEENCRVPPSTKRASGVVISAN